MHTSSKPESGTAHSYVHTPTRTVEVNGSRFAYRQLGPDSGTPVILLNHLGGNLDNWDPRVVDGLAAHHRVITFDNRGVGASEGSTPTTIAAMARDAVSFVRALGFDRVDLVGFSLGGFITQVLARDEPQLVRRIVLAGTGPAGGEGIDKVTSITIKDMIRAALTFSDPKRYLFFTRTANGQQAARDFLARLKERTEGRDAAISPWTFRAQLKAIHAWGRQQPADLSGIVAPALVVNGDADRMVPSSNTLDVLAGTRGCARERRLC
jgi:pimeloyl-ACP methyl ester carboxylesterase